MENLALELLEHIFILACIDGGRTGCALSLVSTHIRAASRTARFYSIALTSGSPAQIASFVACLIPTTVAFPGCPPRVRHLCLTLHTRTRGREQEGGTMLKATPTVRALFRAVAPGLRSLALVVRGELAWVDVFAQLGMGFPALEELTYESQWIQDDESENEDEDELQEAGLEDRRECSAVQLFLHLARLHLVADAAMDFASWAAHAPCLTHLCISKLGFQDYDAVRAVIDNARTAPVFPHLERLLFLTGKQPRPGRCGNAAMKYKQYLSMLQSMQDKATDAPFEVVITKPIGRTDFQGEDGEDMSVVQWGWLARVDGGLGCWHAVALDTASL